MMEHSDSYILLQFVFKQFIRFLKQKNLYGAFVSNLNSTKGDSNYLNSPIFFDEYYFISYSFKWSQTHEGIDVWYGLKLEWGKVLNSFLEQVYANNPRLVIRGLWAEYKISYHEHDAQDLKRRIYNLLTKFKSYDER